jgi:CrcB protein
VGGTESRSVELLLDPDAEPPRPVAAGGDAIWRTWWLLVAIGGGGAVGALVRYGVTLGLPASPRSFPWGTFVVNVSGSALLGAFLIVLIERFPAHRSVRLVLATGVVGAYTTFSTLVVQAVVLIRNGHPATAASYVLSSVIVGLLAAWAGLAGARWALGSRERAPRSGRRR